MLIPGFPFRIARDIDSNLVIARGIIMFVKDVYLIKMNLPDAAVVEPAKLYWAQRRVLVSA